MTINKKVAAFASGVALVAQLGLASIVSGKEVAASKKRPNNLADYGIPSVEGLTPYKTKWLDLTDNVSGKETRLDIYKVDGSMVATYSINGKIFQVAFDHDWKAPADTNVLDKNGEGNYQPFPSNIGYSAPNWVTK